jgi:hypothetical protein
MTATTFAQSQSFAVPQRSGFSIRLSLSLWNIMLLGIVAVMGVWYLVQVNATMDKGYKIRDAQSQLSELQAQARSNQVKLTEMETVSNLTTQATALGMVPVGSVEYVNRTPGGVALR